MRLQSEVRLYSIEVAILKPLGELQMADVPQILEWIQKQKARGVRRFVMTTDKIVSDGATVLLVIKSITDALAHDDQLAICIASDEVTDTLEAVSFSGKVTFFANETDAVNALSR